MTLHHQQRADRLADYAVDLADLLNALLEEDREWGGLLEWQKVWIYNVLSEAPDDIRLRMRGTVNAQVLEKQTRRDWKKQIEGYRVDRILVDETMVTAP